MVAHNWPHLVSRSRSQSVSGDPPVGLQLRFLGLNLFLPTGAAEQTNPIDWNVPELQLGVWPPGRDSAGVYRPSRSCWVGGGSTTSGSTSEQNRSESKSRGQETAAASVFMSNTFRRQSSCWKNRKRPWSRGCCCYHSNHRWGEPRQHEGRRTRLMILRRRRVAINELVKDRVMKRSLTREERKVKGHDKLLAKKVHH